VTDLGAVLDAYRAKADVLDSVGHDREASLVRQIVAEVERSAEDWLTWLPEGDAMLRSGRARPWLRARFPQWERDGHARMRGRERQYRLCVVPSRTDASSAAADGADAARRMRGAA
jgi:hypothetical protein